MRERDGGGAHVTAGMGAEEQARLAARRVEEKRRELERAEQQLHAWSAGAEGERLVAPTSTTSSSAPAASLSWMPRTGAAASR